MGKAKLLKKLRDSFGRVPDLCYFPGDMENIRAYYDFRRAREEGFLLDDITWADLDMDRLFRRINPGLSTSGEQYLYYMLRSPATERPEYDSRAELIGEMERSPHLRLKVQLILARLGRSRRADLCSAFHPDSRSPLRLTLYLLLALLVPLAALSILFWPTYGALALIASLCLNSMVHELVTRRIQKDLDTVNYSVSMVFAMKRIRDLKAPELDRHLIGAYGSLERLRPVLRTGGVSTSPDTGGPGDLVTTLLLLDLIVYELLKNRLGRCREDVFAVHEHLGRLDAAIAVASYRASLDVWCQPELDFSAPAPLLEGEDMCHPLLGTPVPNSLSTARSILVTGSNASGKSTFLKTTALCALMAQSICTCTARRYRAGVFRLMSSMALRDDLLAGESYYIVETRSLKRILDGAAGMPPVLCVVDEVLRGTNTVERIAASSTVLQALAERGALCLAATHDGELCALLEDRYALYHFQERVGEDAMDFNYRLRPGPATSRNAIDLLRLMGFDSAIVDKAHRRAARWLDTGAWT